MKLLKEYKYFTIIMLVLLVIILLPPILHQQNYLVINNDTIAHLKAFESIKSGHPVFLYLGQEITGYTLVGIEKITGIPVQESFMWFNFLALFLAGLVTAIMVIYITKSKLAGIVTAPVIIFGIGSTMHLFGSGTIFNIIEMLVLLPILLIMIFETARSRNVKYGFTAAAFAIFTFMFHPSLGQGMLTVGVHSPQIVPVNPSIYTEEIINPVLAIPLLFGITNVVTFVVCFMAKQKLEIETKVVCWILLGLASIMLILAMSGVTNFSSRMMINFCLVLGILLCIIIGIVLHGNAVKKIKYSIVGLAIIGTIPNLIYWLSMNGYKVIGAA